MDDIIPTLSRVSRSKMSARANYNRMSRWYDWISGGAEKKYRDIGLQKLGANPGEQILEIGFGTGHCLVALARSVGDTGKVFGIDISEGMMEVARVRLRDAVLSYRVELHQGDATTLPFDPVAFDAIFVSFTLELFDTPEIPVMLRECLRVLRTGGRICVVALSKEHESWTTRMYEWFHEKFPKIIDCRPIFVQQALSDSGFEAVDVNLTSMWGLPVEIALAWKKS